MFEHFEDFYFTHSGLFNDLILLRLFKLLDGHDFLVLIATALEYDSVGSLTDQP